MQPNSTQVRRLLQLQLIHNIWLYLGELQSMPELENQLKPIIKNVWHGRKLPFPVLLDSTFETWKRYGLHFLGTEVLLNPNGKLVMGDENTLAEKLK